MNTMYLVLILAIGVFAADRILLWFEARGWINYRRNGLSRGAATYHTLRLSSIFNPAMKPVIEAKYSVQEERDDTGDPPAPDELEDEDPTGASN